jgi:hypothetical protein
MENMACLLAGWWWDLVFRYRLVCMCVCVRVRVLPAHTMSQGTIRFPVYISIQEVDVAIHLSPW